MRITLNKKGFLLAFVFVLAAGYMQLNAQNATFGFENMSGFNTKTVTDQDNGYTLVVNSEVYPLYRGSQNLWVINGVHSLETGDNPESKLTFRLSDGKIFDLRSFSLINASQSEQFLLTSEKGTATIDVSDQMQVITIDISSNPNASNMRGISYFTITPLPPAGHPDDMGFLLALDDLQFENISIANPTVTTNGATSITSSGAVLSGNLVADGGNTILEKGFVYATTANPTTSNSKVTVAGTAPGAFSGNVSGLPSNTTIHFRAYATNSAGTNYGSNLSFTTAPPPGPTVSSVAVPANSTYKIGDVLSFTVTFSANVFVIGTPQLGLTIGSSGKQANYASGSGTSALTFNYTVVTGDLDADGISIGLLNLNGGTIKDAANSNATLTLNSVASSAGVRIDGVAPVVTDARISISGAGGTGGAYRTGNTVTASWNNTAGGDNNSDVASVTINFSQFGGGSAVPAINTSGTWTASYTLTSGGIDASNRNISVTATDNAGNITTTTDGTNATVDIIAPTVTAAKIGVSGASGAGGVYKAGDVVSVSWNNSPAGDNNADVISSVTADFSQFGGGSAVIATNSSGVWSAAYTIPPGNLEGINKHTSMTVTDNAGNTTTTADGINSAVDNKSPSVLSINRAGASPTGASTVTYTVTFSDPVTGVDNTDFTMSAIGSVSASLATITTADNIVYTVSVNILSGDGTLRLDLNSTGTGITDVSGNNISGGHAGDQLYTIIGVPILTTVGIVSNNGISQGKAKVGDIVTLSFTSGTAIQLPVVTIATHPVTVTSTGSNNWQAAYELTSGETEGPVSFTIDFEDLLNTPGTQVTATTNASSVLFDKTAPSISSVTATSSNGTYKGGDIINITLSFSEAITVTGTPALALNSGGTANYTTGSGTSILTFDYTVVAGDNSADLDYTATNALTLAGGTMTDGAGNIATLTLPVPGATNSLGANKAIVIDAIAPETTISGNPPSITSQANASFTFTSDDPGATFEAKLDAGAYVSAATPYNLTGLSEGIHTLTIRAKDAAGNVDATPASYTWTTDFTPPSTNITSMALSDDSGVSSTDFITNVAGQTISGTLSANLQTAETVDVSVNNGNTWTTAVTVPGGNTFTIAAVLAGSNAIRVRVKDAAGNSGSSYMRVYVLDTSVPAAPSAPVIALVSDSGIPGDHITNVTLPVLTGTTEPGSTVKFYDETTLVGVATAVTGNWNIQLTTHLTEGSHTIKATATDAAGNTSGNSDPLTLTTDLTSPFVTNVNVPADMTYKTGDVLNFTVNFSEPVTVTVGSGAPYINLRLNTVGTVQATYQSGSGTTALLFNYTIADGDMDPDGITLGSNIIMNGGAIQDAAGNGAVPTLNNAGPVSGVKVDAAAPVVASVSVPADNTYHEGENLDFIVNFSEPVSFGDGIPYITLTLGSTVKHAVYVPGPASSTALFRYTIQQGDLDINGITPGNTITLNGGNISDAAGNNALPALNNTGNTSGVLVDASISHVATLSNLVLSTGALTPAFSTTTTSYAASVPNAVNNINVTPLTTSDKATVKINGNTATSGQPGTAISLNVGQNTIAIAVTAEDGTTLETYTVTVTRDKFTPAITFTDLNKTYGDADFDAGAVSDNNNTDIVYNSSNTGVATIVNGKIHIVGAGSAYITASQAADAIHYAAGDVIKLLTVNKAAVTVTADAKSKTYGQTDPVLTYHITSGALIGADVFTGSLTRDAGENAGIYVIKQGSLTLGNNYTLTYNGASLEVTQAVLTITANNQIRNYGQPNPPLSVTCSGFVNGETPAVLTSQATASTTATAASAPGIYPITATGALSTNYSFRYVPGTLTVLPLHNAGLSGLSVSTGTLLPSFITGTRNYKVSVGYSIDRITITTVFDPTATARVNGTSAGNGTPTPVTLNTGENIVEVVVTAQDGTTTETYRIMAYRAVPPAAVIATNVLSPNGDGKNDYWVIKDIDLYPGNTVTVFDSGGRTVYSAKNYNNDWDGTLHQSPLAQGTYYYQIDLGPDLPKIKGYITILRNNR